MRIAIVAESFLPHMNGVTGSVLRVLDQLAVRGHQAVVIAAGHGAPYAYRDTPVLHLPSVGLPRYPQVRLCLASQRRMTDMLSAFAPDVVHLASPLLLGNTAMKAAVAQHLPTVAVFQTDVAAFADRYGFPGWSARIWARTVEIHQQADLTLAPSRHSATELAARGIPRVQLWGRGVDAQRFSPTRRDQTLRARWQRGDTGIRLVGYLGRLAPEKQLEDLAALAGLPRTRLVFIGDGPSRSKLQTQFPEAVFTGHLDGLELPAAVAALDVMVHPGESETFCQSVQETLASGVPVVAPRIGGPAELVDSSRTGWLYPPGDLAGMRAAVADLAGDAAKRRAFSAAARAAVAPRSWSRLGDALIEHYRAVLDRRPAVRRSA
ncbi:glycosyltransferase family 1 protein [Nakamurella sp. DB0629]|uniref:Glycosyltransferase family 1 protein n=1 Tax=Nakamurella aerolata TaxID=1656892 RepID=A0A849A9A5_9ACTN|nr:glycosyltransferase family 1 protein [Nakamurella aerolata]